MCSLIVSSRRSMASMPSAADLSSAPRAIRHKQESEPLLHVAIGSGEGGIERSLVDRTGVDSCAAGFPLGHHPVAYSEMGGEVAQAHPACLAQSADFGARPPANHRCRRQVPGQVAARHGSHCRAGGIRRGPR